MPRPETDDPDDESPRRPRRRDPRDDDRGRPGGKPGLATAAAVLWLISAGLLLLVFLVRTVFVLGDLAADGDRNPLCGGLDLALVLGTAGWACYAGLVTALGRARSLTALGVLSLVLPPAVVFLETVCAFFIGLGLAQDHPGNDGLPMKLALKSLLFNGLLTSGVFLAGLFALGANAGYRAWRGRD